MSCRLEAVLSFVKGRTLADIGTDHAYLPIAACQKGLIEYAYACDVSAGPLKKAEENIKRCGLEEKISTRLGFGLKPLQPGEAECVVIAGMGGMRIIDILKDIPKLKTNRLVVQPQHDIPAVRRSLHELGFIICDEAMVREDERFYTIIAAGSQDEPYKETYSELEYTFGKCLIDRKDKILKAYADRELIRLSERDKRKSALTEVAKWL